MSEDLGARRSELLAELGEVGLAMEERKVAGLHFADLSRQRKIIESELSRIKDAVKMDYASERRMSVVELVHAARRLLVVLDDDHAGQAVYDAACDRLEQACAKMPKYELEEVHG